MAKVPQGKHEAENKMKPNETATVTPSSPPRVVGRKSDTLVFLGMDEEKEKERLVKEKLSKANGVVNDDALVYAVLKEGRKPEIPDPTWKSQQDKYEKPIGKAPPKLDFDSASMIWKKNKRYDAELRRMEYPRQVGDRVYVRTEDETWKRAIIEAVSTMGILHVYLEEGVKKSLQVNDTTGNVQCWSTKKVEPEAEEEGVEGHYRMKVTAQPKKRRPGQPLTMSKKKQKVDESNDFCDKCNSGGDLLCCRYMYTLRISRALITLLTFHHGLDHLVILSS